MIIIFFFHTRTTYVYTEIVFVLLLQYYAKDRKEAKLLTFQILQQQNCVWSRSQIAVLGHQSPGSPGHRRDAAEKGQKPIFLLHLT